MNKIKYPMQQDDNNSSNKNNDDDNDNNNNNDSYVNEDETDNEDQNDKVNNLPLSKDDPNSAKSPIDPQSQQQQQGNESKTIQAFFGSEKYPAEYYFKETQRYIRQGQDRKAFVILDKFYERNKKEAFSESILMKLGRRYLTCGLNILKQYQSRDELHTKGQSMILLKKLSTMIILWYSALIKILDKNRCYNKEFIIPEEQSASNTSTPNPFNMNNSQKSSHFNRKPTGQSTFSNFIHKLEKEKRDEQKAIFKYPELSLDLIMTDLIHPSLISNITDDVNITKNLVDFWCLLIDLLLIWSYYYKKMQDAWASYKYIRKAEQFIQQKFIQNTEEIKLLEVSQKVRMMQGQILSELGLFSDSVDIYQEAFHLQQQILIQQINSKNFLPKDAKELLITMANEKIEKTVCKMCVCLLNQQNCYEQLDRLEQGMECLRLLYWLSMTFIKQQQYSDLLTESFKTYQLYSSKYDELITMNAEINKVFSLALNRGQKYIISSTDEINTNNQDFLEFINQYLYKKSNAEELNQVLHVMTKRKPSIDILQTKTQEHAKNEKIQEQLQHLYFSAKSNNSLTSQQNRMNKINDSKETYYTDNNSILTKQNDQKNNAIIQTINTDDSLLHSISNNHLTTINNNNTTNLSGINLKKDYFLNKTYNNVISTEQLLTLNEEQPISPEKNNNNNYININTNNNSHGNFQQQRIQAITTSSFLHGFNNQTDGNIGYNNKSTQNILSSSSLGKIPFSSSSLKPNQQKFNLIKSVAAFESLNKKKKNDSSKNIVWEKLSKNKKKLHDLQKQQLKQNQDDFLKKYQPKVVSSNKFFQDRQQEHLTDDVNLKNNKELEIDKIFGVHKKKKYNILEHDVDTFADNIIAREILTKSNCLPYNHLKSATEQNLNDYAIEKNEFGFCRKLLQLKKQGMSQNLQERESGYNIHQMNNQMDREAHDIQTTLLVNNEVQEKKKQLEESKRIKSLNLNLDMNLLPTEKEETTNTNTAKFKNIMFHHSKKLGLNNVKKAMKKIASSTHRQHTEPGQQKSLKNLFFAEEEEQLDEDGKMKKTQNINKETIKLHLTDLDNLLQSAQAEIQKSQKSKFLNTHSSFTEFETSKKKNSSNNPMELSIGEKIAKEYGKLSSSTKYYVAKSQGQKINNFFDLVNNKIRLGKIQKEEEQKHRLGTPAMKKTLNEAVRRTSLLRSTFIQHQF